MDFDFSEDQEMIRSSMRSMMDKEYPSEMVREMEDDPKGYDPDLWKKMAELGWLGLSLPEEYGGAGADFLDLMIVIEEMGRKLLSGPFFSTMALCSLPLVRYGSPEQKKESLPGIARGEQIWTLAYLEPSATHDLSGVEMRAQLQDREYHLSGTKTFVPFAHVADYLLVVAGTDEGVEKGITMFIVDGKSSGLTTEVIPTAAHDKQCEVTFDQVRVPENLVLGEVGKGQDIVRYIFQRGAALKSAEMLGGLEVVLDMTNAYAKERIQFDRPIGSFQAIQHKLADLLIEIEGLRYMVYETCWAISADSATDFLISATKAKANEVYQRTCIECIKLHGAVGFTKELDLGLYHLRSKASEHTLGDSQFHREMIARELERYEAPVFSN
jgi:alkylation response protein AidB-like acyl-CoA dehydrogenase